MPSNQVEAIHNQLLANISREERQNLISGCEQVELFFGNILYKPGDKIQYVYFPTHSYISIVMPVNKNSSLDVGLIGNEGMFGYSLLLGMDVAPFYSMVQGPGTALRMEANLFKDKLEKCPQLKQKLQRYLYIALIQLAQTAACNRFHLVEERLARCLLMTRDRAGSNEFHITQEFLAQMLGVRRVGITKAAGMLQRKKIISYSRGNIKIHRGNDLETISCKCYQADKDIYERILKASN